MVADTSSPGIDLSIETEVDPETAARYYQLYRATFGHLATRAVARQLLHREEFLEEMVDPRVHKYVARIDGEVVGLSTLTADLETVPWISPDYFAHHYPEHTARGAVFYLGLTLVDPRYRQSRIFQRMIETVVERLVAERAVCGYDICLFNDETMHFGASIERLLHRSAEVTVEVLDRQTYYAGLFHGPLD